jgi:hypothetical protein
MIPVTRIAMVAALALLARLAPGSQAAESYYVVIFAAQQHDGTNHAHIAHSFGTFVKLTWADQCHPAPRMEAFTISWLPQTMDVHLWRVLPEPGVNVDLPASLALAQRQCQCVSMWGPYEIQPCLYERALARKAELESGHVRYKALDTGFPTARVTNCIHALSDIAFDTKRLRLGTPSWGDPASFFIVQSFRHWIIAEERTHDWLLPPLGLANYPVIRRDLCHNPTERPVARAIQNAAHNQMLKHVQP